MKLVKSKDISLPTGVLGLAATADVTRLYAACMDGIVYECDPAAGTVAPLPDRHSSFASSCVLLPGGQTLISAGYDGRLLWHDLAAKKLIRSVQAHAFWSWRLVLSTDGSRVASTSTRPAMLTRRIRQDVLPSSITSPAMLSTAKSSSTVPTTVPSGSATTV